MDEDPLLDRTLGQGMGPLVPRSGPSSAFLPAHTAATAG
jgi:hypothetical protein